MNPPMNRLLFVCVFSCMLDASKNSKNPSSDVITVCEWKVAASSSQFNNLFSHGVPRVKTIKA